MGAADVMAMLNQLLRGLVDRTIEPENDPPPAARVWLDDLLSTVSTYRDAAVIVLAYAVDAGSTESMTLPPEGRRTVAQMFATLCDELSIRARRDAFQTIAKGSATLLGREKPSWNSLLEWGEGEATVEEVRQALRYMATQIAATARSLPDMPLLDVSRLIFQRVIKVVEGLLSQASGGAHEQFVFAALLQAVAEEYGNRRVDTKTLSAADASAGTAADVQVWEGGRVVEAYEVTANPWSTKVAQAVVTLHLHDLPRVHIVARDANPTAEQIGAAVAEASLPAGVVPENVDLSVLDVRAECRSLVHRLTRPGRRAALQKLYEHLATRQPNDELVGQYVTRLEEAGVTATE